MNPHIIGISGNMGAGKSTLAKALSNTLAATLISWDDFDEISNGPNDYVDWHKRGKDYSEWNYQTLAVSLQKLKSKKIIVHPVIKVNLNPTKNIIFDAPLGRFHEQTGEYIDTWVHIKVPLDVSLCRWLIRDFKPSHKTKNELMEEIEFYLSSSRPLFFDDQMKLKADFIVDGMLSTDQQCRLIKHYLNGE